MNNLKVGDIILSQDGKQIDLVITDLSENFMVENEVSMLISFGGKVYREVDVNDE